MARRRTRFADRPLTTVTDDFSSTNTDSLARSASRTFSSSLFSDRQDNHLCGTFSRRSNFSDHFSSMLIDCSSIYTTYTPHSSNLILVTVMFRIGVNRLNVPMATLYFFLSILITNQFLLVSSFRLMHNDADQVEIVACESSLPSTRPTSLLL